MGAQTSEKIHQSASMASNWTRLVYMPSNSNCEERTIMFYTVNVGGVDVCDYLQTKEKAKSIADAYIDVGYDDVAVVCYQDFTLDGEGLDPVEVQT